MSRALEHVALLLIGALVSAAAANAPLPDPRTGNVNGLSGLLFWPADLPGPHGQPRPLATADGCDVHVVADGERGRELTFPCGKWFVLPSVGHHDYWAEMDGRITPSMGLLYFGRSPFSGRGTATIVPVAPAGRIATPSEHSMPETEDLRLLSVEARDSWNSSIFDRRVAAADAHRGAQMPEGRVVAGRFDRKTNDAVALTRPIELPAGRVVRVWPEPPSDSDVLVVLTKPRELQLGKPIAARLSLNKHAPDVLVNGSDRVIAIWYGVAARHAALVFESDRAFWAPREVALTRGKVTTVRSALQRLPKAQVSIQSPSGIAISEKLSLTVRRPGAKEPIRSIGIEPGTHDVTALPAELLSLTLHVGDWRLTEMLDLSSGQDGFVAFELQPIAIHGTVLHGDERAAAEIELLNEEEWRVVKTDDRGEYAATLWWPGVYAARVKLAGRTQAAYLDPFREIFESGRVDFRVPRTDYVVHVRDASTGRPVAQAVVNAGSEAAGGMRISQRLLTDDSGTAVLPPLRDGDLVVSVRADRYATPEPARVRVDDRHHEIDIALQPLRTAATIELRLADGAPAAEAEAWAFDRSMNPVWRGTADAAGRLDLPESAAGGYVLIRHPAFASTIRATPADDPVTWTLERPADPLTVVAEQKTAGALVAVWLDGIKLSGPPLSFAAWSAPVTDASGTWTGRNLPPTPLRILLLPQSAYGSSAFDAVARPVGYPWPAPLVAVVQ